MLLRLFNLFSIAALTAFGVAAPALPAWAAPTRLVILHTNDTHSHLAPYDKREIKSVGGIARRATLIKKEQIQNAGRVLVLDGGDCFQGTPLFNFFKGEAEYAAMDAAGYDASTVGNHDLDEGLRNLQKQHSGRKFKLINTNLLDAKTGKPLFLPSWIVERGGVKVGIFGILGEDSAWGAIAPRHQAGIKVLPAASVASQSVAALRAAGAEIIVMLSHSGLAEDKQLAAAVPGIHVIVGGHSHTKVDAPVPVKSGSWTTLVLQGYQWGEYLGRLELEVDKGKILSSNGYLVPVAGDTPEDPAIKKVVDGFYAKVPLDIQQVIGRAPKGISREGSYDRDSEMGNWATDLLRTRTGSDVAILNSGGLRSDLLPGPVTVGDVFMIFPFENRVVKLDLKGSLLKRILDAVASRKLNMLQVSGLTFRIEGGAATDVRVGGAPLDPDRSYHVTTIDYIAQGGDKYVLFTEADERSYQDTGVLLRDFVLEGIKGNPTLEPPTDRRIQGGSR